MRKVIRIRCIIIVAVFALVAAASVAIIFSNADAHAFSAFTKGSGTQSDPYVISNMNQLNNLQAIAASDLAEEYTKDKYFKLDRDITTAYNVTSELNGFFGHLDGNGHTVTVLGSTGLFYRLANGASITNLTVNINIKVSRAMDYYGMVYYTESSAVIDNCTVKGTINIDFTKWKNPGKNYSLIAHFSAFCIQNNGTISNCRFEGSVLNNGLDTSGKIINIYGSVFAYTGQGLITNCSIVGNVHLVANTYTLKFSTFSSLNMVRDCEFTGNITISLIEPTDSYTARSFTVYALGRYAIDSTFTGDVIIDHRNHTVPTRAQHHVYIGADETCLHNGEIKEINKKSN